MRAVRFSCAVCCTRLAGALRRNGDWEEARRIRGRHYARPRLVRHRLTGSSRLGAAGAPRGATSCALPLSAAQLCGCSSRETSFSIEPVVSAPSWRALSLFLACGALEAGASLFGSLLAVMIGGGVAITEPRTSRGSRMRRPCPAAQDQLSLSLRLGCATAGAELHSDTPRGRRRMDYRRHTLRRRGGTHRDRAPANYIQISQQLGEGGSTGGSSWPPRRSPCGGDYQQPPSPLYGSA